jgi:hypothetical protein
MENRCSKCGQIREIKDLGFDKAIKRMNRLMKKWHKEEMNDR